MGRSVCGMTFHNILDRLYYLLGGCATAAHQGNPESVFVWGGISSWMSVASTIQTSSDKEVIELIDYLEVLLLDQSFLVNSPDVTLADLDVYFALKSRDIDVAGK